MSCRRWVETTVHACVRWAAETRDECVRESRVRVRRCTERAETSREECAEWEEDRTRECGEWGEERHSECCDWIPCSWACDAVVWIVETVCKSWVWVTTRVCTAYHTVVELSCVAWEWLTRTVCTLWAAVVTGVCTAWGWITQLICTVMDSFAWQIVESHDQPQADSVEKPRATSMSVGAATQNTAYRDSGLRRFFRIVDGVIEARQMGGDWRPVTRPRSDQVEAMSYHVTRSGRPIVPLPYFDMVAANSGRVFAKERRRARFYFTILEPMFRGIGNVPVISAYFKLDPEQGRVDADNADRLQHLVGPDASADPTHPAAVRFPVFRLLTQIDQNDSMIVNVDRNMGVWHRIDARPPKDDGEIPKNDAIPPTTTVVVYGQPGLPFWRRWQNARPGYDIRKVLDIGVGHMHWHEQRCAVYGGEMDSLDGPGLRLVLRGRDVYRFFNGPVDDQGGFIDNTINYYVLAQFFDDEELKADPGRRRRAFGILWLDEQAVLSERWRLVHPDDSRFGGFRQIVPSSVVQYMDLDFNYENFLFDRTRFWCPFRDEHIDDSSRMAVSRQVIIVSGRDPKTGVEELYSIHFAFGTADRTWRRRNVPPVRREGHGREALELGLREDMTIFVSASKSDGQVWYQRYLPAPSKMRPGGEALKLAPGTLVRPDFDSQPADAETRRRRNGPKPEEAFDHPWQRLPREVFDYAHEHFSHFGCYEPEVNWRWQYYRVEVLSGERHIAARGEEAAWVEDGDRLLIRKHSIDWAVLNGALQGDFDPLSIVSAELWARVQLAFSRFIIGTLTVDELATLVEELRNTPFVRFEHRRGLFHPHFLVKLLYREPLGWIVVHWDKRDDDLLPFRDWSATGGTPFEISLVPGMTPTAAAEATVRFVSYHQVVDIPAVAEARVIVLTEGNDAVRLRVELQPFKSGAALDENVWRVKLGALRRSSSGELAGADTFLDEVRVRAPIQEVGSGGRLIYEWDVGELSEAARARLRDCCTEDGRTRFGTSLWLEDVVGHVATPDSTEFASHATGVVS